jgi:hypothetical protein
MDLSMFDDGIVDLAIRFRSSNQPAAISGDTGDTN